MANHSKERTQAEAQLKKTQKAQRATVLQLPAAARPEVRENQATREVCEPSLSS